MLGKRLGGAIESSGLLGDLWKTWGSSEELGGSTESLSLTFRSAFGAPAVLPRRSYGAPVEVLPSS